MKRATSFPNQSLRFRSTVEFYNTSAHELTAKYEARTFEQVHSPILKFLPTSPAFLLDVGAGFERGFEVGMRVDAVHLGRFDQLMECIPLAD